MGQKELQVVMLGVELMLCGELVSSSTFAVELLSVSFKTLSLWRIQTLSLNTVFIDYS